MFELVVATVAADVPGVRDELLEPGGPFVGLVAAVDGPFDDGPLGIVELRDGRRLDTGPGAEVVQPEDVLAGADGLDREARRIGCGVCISWSVRRGRRGCPAGCLRRVV
ncbi:hypothetical protein [Haloarchaeobius sp. FL176]|uniref:hypothetical protein n=1 Tax=Haloarchaeobius sp. FL176 TaxID=2967129 RepID=UPI00214935A8|nr:hypothetical protein [Haloarchaeobius sp. FL176]